VQPGHGHRSAPAARFKKEGHKHHAKPIKGRCAIDFQVEVLERGPGGQITKARTPFSGTCKISGLGRTAVTGDPTVTLNSDGSGAASGPVEFRGKHGKHGAELRAAGAATFPPLASVGDGDADADDEIPLTGTLEFNGGTGRFEEADGSAALGLRIDLARRRGELEFRGETSR